MNCLILLLLLAQNGRDDRDCGCDRRNDRDGGRDNRDGGCGRRNDRDNDRDCGCDRGNDRDGGRDGRDRGNDCDGDRNGEDYGRGWDRSNDARPAAWDSDCGCNGDSGRGNGPRQGFPSLNRNDTCGCENQN